MELPEPPECPVCLQPYDSTSTTPRVLACGHSACDNCLPRLPQPFPHTVRCPACTQLVKFQGPSSLPKNIDLLRLAYSLLKPDGKDRPKPAYLDAKPSTPVTDRQLYRIYGLMSFIWHGRTGLFRRRLCWLNLDMKMVYVLCSMGRF